ncbi:MULTISPECIES: MerR family transcriptional regulator [unclassified Salinivibrio]|uniref:MerR family transcriptional regulator n=1 Tax=unclassified Salinivibrio TaxID=2636825 RepID=UPI00128CB333|nr:MULTISPECIES: MerR family transcriptional regulator [unclassified Salinivibrio]MPS31122.1 MerR family transcriptional regulator [Salinivibrio sp. VYel7]MPX92523.1 MerR family transcriptional regulator [Salinivibrio sp. VYel9]MPX96979.1 MerR family transcriptional regulator [Salinivibrio sp. VYel6]MPX98755.1 MerR family transcriptional regulator [Salinivibrio sp. VYel4]MPY01544.1 MerR family transcriptional regulator [Salinivibrio sp. VYel5]
MAFNTTHTLTISQVADQTGVNPVTLRAWQRRYGLLAPERTAKGHRLYRQEDVETIAHILQWLDKGVPISKVKPLLAHSPASAEAEDDSVAQELIDCIHTFSVKRLGKALDMILKEYPFYWLVEHAFTPIDQWLGDEDEAVRVLQRDLWQSAVIDRCRTALAANAKRHAQSRCWLVSLTVTSEYQRVLMAMALNEKGYSVTMLSSPHQQLNLVVEVMREQGVTTLALMANRRLDRAQINQVRHCLAQDDIDVVSQAFICSVHGDELEELKENKTLCI